MYTMFCKYNVLHSSRYYLDTLAAGRVVSDGAGDDINVKQVATGALTK